MVRDQLMGHQPLFHNFKWFNIKAALAHHPIIQNEVDELLAKVTSEPLMGGTGFYSNVLVGFKCIGGLCDPYSILIK